MEATLRLYEFIFFISVLLVNRGSSNAPEFDFGLPTSIVAGYGEDVEIPCVVKGIQEPAVKWKHGEGNLKQKTKVFVDEKNSLIIMNVKTDDEGTYYCSAENKDGKNTYKVNLVVKGDPPIFTEVPKRRQEVKVGEKLKLPCRAYGAPIPHIKWYFDGKTLAVGNHFHLERNGDLILQNARLSDSGEYSCKAENLFGSDTTACDLIVTTSSQD